MGMYDTINGEQVKCFPWVSFYEGAVTYHCGDLKYYNNGDKVPYRMPHYNYGSNFIILDYNRFPESNYCDYDFYIHSNQDVLNFIKSQRDYISKREEIYNHWNELLKEMTEYAAGIVLFKKDSEERILRQQKINEIHSLMREEERHFQPEMEALNESVKK